MNLRKLIRIGRKVNDPSQKILKNKRALITLKVDRMACTINRNRGSLLITGNNQLIS